MKDKMLNWLVGKGKQQLSNSLVKLIYKASKMIK